MKLLFGQWLGATLNSGYSRDIGGLGYGFELTYENLIHKLGVVSVFPIFIYNIIFTAFFIIKTKSRILDQHHRFNYFISLLMGTHIFHLLLYLFYQLCFWFKNNLEY